MSDDSDSDGENFIRNVRLLGARKQKSKQISKEYIFAFVVLLIHSIFSLFMIYFYYILRTKIGGDSNVYTILKVVFGSIIFVCISFIINISKTEFYTKHKKCSNYSIFILSIIVQICFESIDHMNQILSKDESQTQFDIEEPFRTPEVNYEINKRILFSIYEARLYYKVSECIFYLILIFYFYFRKSKKYFKRLLLLFIAICLCIDILLTIFIKKYDYDGYNLSINSSIWLLCFLFFILKVLLFGAVAYGHKLYKAFKEDFVIEWKVNILYTIKNGIVIFFYSQVFIKYLKKKLLKKQ